MTAATSIALKPTTKAHPTKPSGRSSRTGTRLPLNPTPVPSAAEREPVHKARSAQHRRWYRETRLAIMEEKVATLEKAALLLLSTVQGQRSLLEGLKENEGFDFKVPAPCALFGDAVLFREYEVQVVELVTPVEPVFEDGVFERIAMHRAAYDAYEAAYNSDALEREKTDIALDRAFEDLVRHKPYSEVGALALIAYMREYAQRTENWDTSGHVGKMLDAATAVAAHVLPRTKQTEALKLPR